jgi:hypothetical protein
VTGVPGDRSSSLGWVGANRSRRICSCSSTNFGFTTLVFKKMQPLRDSIAGDRRLPRAGQGSEVRSKEVMCKGG